MRELTFVETGYLASLLLASLVLPILLTVLAPVGRTRTISIRIVWAGQLLLSIAGATLLFSATLAMFAAVFGIVIVMTCASALFCLRSTPARVKA